MLMTNRERILGFLRNHPDQSFDDDELSQQLGIRPRQQVNQICRTLAEHGLVFRQKQQGKIRNSFSADAKPPLSKEPELKLFDEFLLTKFQKLEPKVYDYLEKAVGYWEADPEASLNNVRKVIEGVCYKLGEQSLGRKRFREFKRAGLQEKVDILEQRGVFDDKMVRDAIHQLRKRGNLGSHYPEGMQIEPQHARTTLFFLSDVLAWYVARFDFWGTHM